MHAYRVYIIVLLISMDCQLADMERKCGIQSRWKKSDREYVEAKHIFLMEKQAQLLSCLWAAVVKRQYLLQLKAKYAGIAIYITHSHSYRLAIITITQ